MKNLFEKVPLIILGVVFAVVVALFATGAFDAPSEVTITSSTIQEAIKTAKMSTAKYIQHGIAKAHIEGKQDGYILYYATVKLNVDLTKITYDLDESAKKITVYFPEKFEYDVKLLEDNGYKYYYYPDNRDDWTGKDVGYICTTDAKQKAEANMELGKNAREGLEQTIKGLLKPMLSKGNYTLEFVVRTEQGA